VRERRINLTVKIGKELEQRIMLRDSSIGGMVLECLGVQGSGKTSFMLSIAEDIINDYPDELIFWRDSYYSQCQFNRFKNWMIHVEDGVEIQFKDIDKGIIVDVPISKFSGFNELIQNAKPGMLNVVYLKSNYDYLTMIRFLRLYKGFQTFFIDEYEDIAPLRASGKQWKKNEELSNEFKHIRRGLVNLICNTQNPSDVDWRVRSKIMCHAYLYGSKVDGQSPIEQGAVNRLKIGQWYMDYGYALFGKGSFDSFPPTIPVLIATDLNNMI